MYVWPHKHEPMSCSNCSFGMRPENCNNKIVASAVLDLSRCHDDRPSAVRDMAKAHELGSCA